MIIGITGKSGVGKTTYTRKLSRELGIPAVFIDEISHQVLETDYIKSLLINTFGADVIQKDGTVDRKYMGDLVFTTRHQYELTSSLIWVEVKDQINSILRSNENLILDWILLPHSHYWSICDKKILITADEEMRKKKVLERDNISIEYLNKRDSAGISYESYHFDEIIENTYQEGGINNGFYIKENR